MPTRYLCVNAAGQPDGTPGAVVQHLSTGELGNCLYLDGTTPVDPTVVSTGDFAYCGGNGAICNNTYPGAYANSTYDPRFRPWYIETRDLQQPIWSAPFLFFDDVVFGITYSQPIYEHDAMGRQVFKGVIAYDYLLDEISRYLFDTYNGTNVHVLVVEDAAPHFVIATSSGSATAQLQDGSIDRIPVDQMDASTNDVILRQAFFEQQEAAFPSNGFVAVHVPGERIPSYVCQSETFQVSNLIWGLVVTSPIGEVVYDASVPDHESFEGILIVTGVALFVCASMFVALLVKRNDPAFQCADWRFTCSFVAGCTAMNFTNLALLGIPTDDTCLLRSWCFHGIFACGTWRVTWRTIRESIAYYRDPV